MPRGDRTGPAGMGPMTGRAAGYCAGYAVPGFVNPVPGGGLGLGFGCRAGGRGWRHVFYATGVPGWMRADYQPPAPEAELAALKAQASALGDQLDAINQRIEELESHRAEEE